MSDQIIELNVGGFFYTTTVTSLLSEPESYFTSNHNAFSDSFDLPKDSQGRVFIDRDGKLFNYIMEFLRTKTVLLPEEFAEKSRLRFEAEFYKLPNMVRLLTNQEGMNSCDNKREDSYEGLAEKSKDISLSPNLNSMRQMKGYVVLGYRGTFANGRDGLADVKFRKVSRILVSGRVNLCREVFGDSLNESRDPDHGVSDRYTSRYYLKHTSLEQAFDHLLDKKFRLICTAATGANCCANRTCDKDITNKQHLMNTDSEENKWLHYSEYVFVRD